MCGRASILGDELLFLSRGKNPGKANFQVEYVKYHTWGADFRRGLPQGVSDLLALMILSALAQAITC